MHKSLADLPVTWGGMMVARQEYPPGMDATPLLKGLPDDKCPCPHWGYVLEGSIHIGYTDGSEEEIVAGEAFYMPEGHTGWTKENEGVVFLEFSPAEPYAEVMAHVGKMMEQLS